MGLSNDLADYLTTGGIADAIFSGELPARPFTALCVTPTAGLGPQRVMGTVAGEHVRIQLRVRGQDFQTAESLMSQAHTLCVRFLERTLNGTRYFDLSAASSPYYLGLNHEELPVFVCNYDVWKETR